MAFIYRLRTGKGDDSIASRAAVDLKEFVSNHSTLSAIHYDQLPTIGDGSVNPYSGPIAVVLHVTDDDPDISQFAKKGYYLLENIEPEEA